MNDSDSMNLVLKKRLCLLPGVALEVKRDSKTQRGLLSMTATDASIGDIYNILSSYAKKMKLHKSGLKNDDIIWYHAAMQHGDFKMNRDTQNGT